MDQFFRCPPQRDRKTTKKWGADHSFPQPAGFPYRFALPKLPALHQVCPLRCPNDFSFGRQLPLLPFVQLPLSPPPNAARPARGLPLLNSAASARSRSSEPSTPSFRQFAPSESTLTPRGIKEAIKKFCAILGRAKPTC